MELITPSLGLYFWVIVGIVVAIVIIRRRGKRKKPDDGEYKK